jgi:hypothetical protein
MYLGAHTRLVILSNSLLEGLGGDGRLVEIATRLRQDAAVEGGIGLAIDAGLDQKVALHVRISFQHDRARDLPEDVLLQWHCAGFTVQVFEPVRHQVHCRARDLHQVTRNLNDEDVRV